MLGYLPKTNFEDGIRNFFEWFKKERKQFFFIEILSDNIFQINLFNNQMKEIRLKQ